MAQVLNYLNIGRIGRYVCFIAVSLFVYSTASASQHYKVPEHTTYANPYHYDLIAVVPSITEVPDPTFVAYSHPKNDQKPVNTNYQVIKQRSLGLINAQMNI